MKNFRMITCIAAATAIMAGCTPTHNVRGNLLEDYQLAEVKPGADTRTDVLRKLGSPTTQGTFDDDIWYYLGQETEKRGILDPEVVAERVVVVFFDGEGVVSEVRDVDPQRVDLPIVRRKTPTTGNEVTFLQQLLGNLGRFNTEEGNE